MIQYQAASLTARRTGVALNHSLVGSGTIDFMKFAVALGKSPGHGLDKTRQAYNFLPKNATDYDLRAIEEKIVHKLEDRCEV